MRFGVCIPTYDQSGDPAVLALAARLLADTWVVEDLGALP